MKKIVCICIALLLSIGVPFVWISGAVTQEKENVSVSERVLHGNRSAANDLKVERLFGYDEHLYWRLTYHAGDMASYETDFFFTATEDYESAERTYQGFFVEEYISIGAELDLPAEDQTGIAQKIKELYDKTPIGKENEQIILLKDVYDYYPLEFHFSLPKISWSGINYENLRAGLDDDEKYVIDTFSNFFKIPLSDTAGYRVNINVYGKNNVSIGSTTVGDFYTPKTESVYTDSVCFFSLSNRANSGKIIDFSSVQGGYGIYSFAYGYGTGLRKTGVDADSLQMVYPLNENETVLSLSLDEEQETLFIFTEDDRGFSLYAVNVATMQTEQTLRFEDEKPLYVENCGDFFFVELNYDRILVIERKDDGLSCAFTVSLDHVNNKWFNSFCAKSFDGERLALVSELYEDESTYLPLCGFDLAVYDETGLIFHAEYLTDIEPNILHAHRDLNTLPAEAKASLFWEKKNDN